MNQATTESRLSPRTNASRWAMQLFLILTAVVTLYPLIWNIYSSFKTNTEFLANPFSLPAGLAWDNYARALEKTNLLSNLGNSVYVVILTLILLIVCVIPSSYCLSRFRFPFSKGILSMYMAAVFIQATYIIIPLFLQMNQLNLINKLSPLAVLYAVMQFPFSIFLLSGFMRGIPRDFEEAAMIDGCGYGRILLSVVTPLAWPGIVTVCMLSAMAAWNEYPVALVLITDPAKQTLPVGLANLYEIQRYATDWGALFAALMMVLIPTILIYVAGQRYLIQGISAGGIKG